MSLELFTRTLENRFVFHLFEFLLSGVIAVVIMKAWRRRSGEGVFRSQWRLLPASLLLSLALGYSALSTGARFFLHMEMAELPVSLASHLCLIAAWTLIALQFVPVLPASAARRFRGWALACSLIVLSLGLIFLAPDRPGAQPLLQGAARILDATGLVILAATVYFVLRSGVPAGRTLAAALSLFWVAGILHLGSAEIVSFPVPVTELRFWNLEQLVFSAALLLLALAIGEMSTELFDIVFIRVQMAFIVLASVIILVVTSTERAEYLMQAQDRSRNLATFLTAGLESLAGSGEPLSSALQREDLLGRIVTDFGNLPELAGLHISAGSQAAAFTIGSRGEIRKAVSTTPAGEPFIREFLNQDRYFLIGSLPLRRNLGKIELYGAKEYFDRYARKRTLLIFSLFTGAVALATLMIGLVAHHAEGTLHRQEEEIRTRQEELVMVSKLAMLGELAGSVAHEVNNPATTIMSRSSFLLKKWKGGGLPPDDRHDLAVILEEARRIARITTSLLGFSRRHVFEIGPVSIGEVVEKSISLLEDDLKEGGVRVAVQGCASTPAVAGDRNSLVEVFINLLRNAVDAMPGGGTVRIEAGPAADPSFVRIRFSDTGEGIAAEHLSRIFVPFFTTKRTGKGTGLGLSVVYGIIAEHKGSIRVESRQGEGTTFHIELPCRGSQ